MKRRIKNATAADQDAWKTRTDLGLAISALSIRPGECRGIKTLAKFCDCSPQAIARISDQAITKVRQALRRRGVVPGSF